MVRSKGESGRDFFHLAEQIRGEKKYFNVSRMELVHRLREDDHVKVEGEHDTTSEDGPVVVPLELRLVARHHYWSAALLLHETRIDGIDWQHAYPCQDGSVQSGWHRHEWDADALKAHIHVPLPATFSAGLRNVNDFLIRISSEMRITWNANDVGFSDYLPLD